MECSRFKFRVWDKSNQRYVDTFSDAYNRIWRYYIDQNGDLIGVGEDNVDRVLDRKNFIIKQCTGIRDMNDVLIYEGDLVQTVTGARGYVRWINGGFCVVFRDGSCCAVCGTQKVIGNIHERK